MPGHDHGRDEALPRRVRASKLKLRFAPSRREDNADGDLLTHIRTPDGIEMPVFGLLRLSELLVNRRPKSRIVLVVSSGQPSCDLRPVVNCFPHRQATPLQLLAK